MKKLLVFTLLFGMMVSCSKKRECENCTESYNKNVKDLEYYLSYGYVGDSQSAIEINVKMKKEAIDRSKQCMDNNCK